MKWLTEKSNLMVKARFGWLTSALAPAGALGFVYWSLTLAWCAIVSLTLLLFIRPLQRYVVLAWAASWTAVWLKFGFWFCYSLQEHHHFLDRVPTYAGAALAAYTSAWAMLAAIGSMSCAASLPEAEQPREEPKTTSAADTGEAEPQTALPCFNPYVGLGIPAVAAASAIKDAYRQQMSAYHPDKVQHLGDDIKAVTRRRTLEIQRAMDYFRESGLC